MSMTKATITIELAPSGDRYSVLYQENDGETKFATITDSFGNADPDHVDESNAVIDGCDWIMNHIPKVSPKSRKAFQ